MKFAIILSCYLLLVSFNVASEPVFDFGQYQVTNKNGCIESDCEIILEKTFTHKPLVFLMPTITNNGLDAPSTLKITAIYEKTAGKYAFKVRQVYPIISDKIELEDGDEFERNKYFELYKIPMMKIAYFAMEEGEITLGHKGRILAGKKEIRHNLEGGIKSLYKNQKLQKHSAEQLVKSGKLVSIPLPKQFKSPGAMGEIQPTIAAIPTDDDVEKNWFTPLMIRNNNHSNNNFGDFYLGVDSSETGAVLHKKVTVGYLLVEGSGFHRGLQFALGSAETPNTLKEDYSGNALVTQPILDQCKGFTTLKNTNFDFSDQINNPILFVASKNSRFGSNGGWVRLCQVETDAAAQRLKVSFVNDEDLNENTHPERAHANEEVGFMAFQRRVAEEVCDVFPGPVQTWQDSAGIFTGSHKVNIKGAKFINSKRYIGFDTVKNSSGPNHNVNDFCNGKQCFSADGNPTLYAEKMLLPTWPSKDDGDFSVDKITPNKKEYWFKTLYLYKNMVVEFPVGTTLHLQDLDLNASVILAANSKNPDDLKIFIHGIEGPVNRPSITFTKGSRLYALIYSERHISMSNGVEEHEATIITGAVTAPAISMTGNNNKLRTEIIGQSACFEAQPEYQLAITPTVATSTLCEPQKITFLVSKIGAADSDFNGDIAFSIHSSSGGKWAHNAEFNHAQSFGVGTSDFVLENSGSSRAIWLQPNGAEMVTVVASIADMVGEQPQGKYTFIPGGFNVTPNNNNIIAGQPFFVTVKAVACANQPNLNDAVITQYHGVKQLEFDTRYAAPSQGQYHVGVVSGDNELSSVKVNFIDGVSEPISMRYRDAGRVNLVVKDKTCTSDYCELITTKTNLLKRSDLPQGLAGEASVQSRPWTFAMCPQGSDSFIGTTNSGNGLVAAGDAFVMRAKPLQWQPGDKVNNSIDVSDDKYCQRPITPNFFAQTAPVVTVTASVVGIDTPQNGDQGELNGTTGQQNNYSHDNTAMIFDNLRWSEVGSVKLAMTADTYLGMKINPSQRAIGRFYPKQFAIKNSSVINAHTESSPFTYMDQTFKANVIVEAQNTAGEATLNYGKFAPRLKESLLLTAVDLNQNRQLNDVSARLDQSNLSSGWQHQWQQAQLTIKDGELAFTRLPKPNNQLATTTTTADGPFKIGLGLSVIPRTDCSALGCTDFANKTQVLQRYNQPQLLTEPLDGNVDSRYGRMVLEDASGVFDQPLTMPLKVEYWKNGQFIINEDDSTSLFNSELSCKQMIYDVSKPHDKAHFMSTSGNIYDGKSYALQVSPGVAENGPYLKQQWRFWLRIAAQPASNIDCSVNQTTHQPWLTFNWRGVGDEDPSGLVTFGSYRGNDRIIYRSETALINP
ncbi:DUF6701 domain-containing protein [Photobacterium aquimaris]|uniref:DUF6701 domain-containing protein n=1 Tax=Photobacterium aquimaris TaxID=512643 RepID=A0A1Y6KYR4_9GAMM|nr:DUF6701 domain-containing protein [Photobacterium aquimaris]SMY17172.1 hypothetical protein PAQU9191_02450 [Photobacterium aquimaris]